MRLLLVEDDRMIGEVVLEALRAEQFAVDWVRDGEHAETSLRAQAYDLVILDLGLPGQDGMKVLASLRARRNQVPVLIATARDAIEQRIEGLNAGADDYLLKPYDIDEMIARIRALLRRAGGRGEPLIEIGATLIDPSSRTVSRDGVDVPLSGREWAVLGALALRPGAVLSRAQIEDKLYSWGEEVSSNTVEVYVHGLRRKLGAELIQTVRGVGYRLAVVERHP